MDTSIAVVRPNVIDDVLVNPGIGFMTFQRFNGDALNVGTKWTEGFPIEYQDFTGSLENRDYPMTSIAYFRVYWRFLEPECGQYRWDLIDKSLATARERKQTLMLRIAPHGTNDREDVPHWFRGIVGANMEFPEGSWMIDPDDPRYPEHFCRFIRALGERYDGHPDLESVDLSIVGSWGEGAGSDVINQASREELVDAYVDSFRKTPLLMLLTDKATNGYGLSRASVGYRADCLGDLRTGAPYLGDFTQFEPATWSHMVDMYPRRIIETGMQDAWMKAPVSFEVCWVVQHWMDMGWDIDYIIDQSLKWHISSFNPKSSPIPEAWRPNVDRWLKKMGYRLTLRRMTYPVAVSRGGRMQFTTWWENQGCAPCYKPFRFALRLVSGDVARVFPFDVDLKKWLPGDSIFDSYIRIPEDLPAGQYRIDAGIIGEKDEDPKVKLAIEELQPDGWYRIGIIDVAD